MRKRIGDFLFEKGVLNSAQIDRIVKHGHEKGLRFGEAGMDLGILSREKLLQVFGPSYAVDFFTLQPQFFPKVTQDLLPVDSILRLGALPLGFKMERKFFRPKKTLNLGLLDPTRQDAIEEALRLAKSKFGERDVQGTKVFLIVADQFLTVLRQVYGMSDADLRSKDSAQVDGTLWMYLEHAQ